MFYVVAQLASGPILQFLKMLVLGVHSTQEKEGMGLLCSMKPVPGNRKAIR